MIIQAFLKNMTQADIEMADIGLTVAVGELKDLRGKSALLIQSSEDLPVELQADNIRMVAIDQATEYSYDVAIAILGGADVNNPLTWGPHVLHPQDFRQRFTYAEQLAIRSAAATDNEVGNIYDFLAMTDHVDLTSGAATGSLDLLVSKGLIDSARKAEILTY